MAKKYGDWEVERRLGEGGQARTFLARARDGRQGVVKRLKNVRSSQRRKRFEQEARVMQEFDHPGIPRVLDMCLDTKEPYIVFEYKKGRTLDELVRKRRDSLEMLHVLLKAGKVIDYIHAKGICHRDLKPSHVIVDSAGGVSIIDFGLAYSGRSDRVTMTYEQVGSRFYMAPELRNGRGNVAPCADVYSLGKVIYFALSGGKRFDREEHKDEGFNLVHMRGDARYEQVNELLDRMICRDPKGRLANAGVVLPELDRIMEYFKMIEWERTFTIKEGELRQMGEPWQPIKGEEGWFTNEHSGQRDWTIFGPYELQPPLPIGLYEAIYILRAHAPSRPTRLLDQVATIDVAAPAGGVLAGAILAARSLDLRDLMPDINQSGIPRQHSLLFFYDGRKDIEFRILKSVEPGRGSSAYSLHFGGIKLRRLKWPGATTSR